MATANITTPQTVHGGMEAAFDHVEMPPETTWTPVVCLLDGTRIMLPEGMSHGDAMDTADLAADDLPNVDYVGAVRDGRLMDNALNVIAEPRVGHAITPLEYDRQNNGQMMSFYVQQDSMEPAIKMGDMVAIDTSVTWWVKDGIYLVNFPSQGPAFPATQILRRVIKIPGQDRYTLSCDSQFYLEHDEIDGGALDLAGFVVEVLSHKRL